jgi:hypothetical protein
MILNSLKKLLITKPIKITISSTYYQLDFIHILRPKQKKCSVNSLSNSPPQPPNTSRKLMET